jgi:NAD(P)H-hydrate epimerase
MNLNQVHETPACPARSDDAHKGTFGTVIVVGGCPTMIGAPALCAVAAFRGGAGLVKIATDAVLLATMIAIEPSVTGIILSSDPNLVESDPEGRAVLAVGPGMGRSKYAAEITLRMLQGKRRMVLDADGLNLLAATGKARPPSECELILTPHPGEFDRLAKPMGITDSATDPATRPLAAAKLAQVQRAVVVLKGRRTVVSDGRRVYENQTGNPALATAGSGDVLTGLIASLVAQGMALFDAAALGTHLHGLAADLWAEQFGRSGLTAQDLAAMLPEAFERKRGG